MKAREVLNRYAEGQRDFRRVNLRGESFREKDLSGADFSEADIRGTNFRGAILHGTKFIAAKAGLQKRWVIGLLIVCFLLLLIAGLCIGVVGAFVLSIFDTSHQDSQVAGWVILIILISFWSFIIRQGIEAGTLVVAIAFPLVFVFSLPLVLAFVLAIAFAVAGAVAGAVAVAVAFAVAFVLAVAVAVAIAESLVGAGAVVIAGAGAVTLINLGLCFYISWRAIQGDEKDRLIRSIAVAMAAFGGTCFRDAELIDANFTKATLKSTDFRGATLTQTCWKNALKLDQVRPGKTYLSDAQVRELVRTGQGENQNFDRKNLQGVYLQGANLVGASFIEANLNHANLQEADLSRAKLVGALLDQTDLTGATLTGAFIEDWNITLETKLNGILCDYIFMRLPPEKRPSFLPLPPEESLNQNPRRKPDDWDRNFEEGEFADFIKPMMKTLDLYHNKKFDPLVFSVAFDEIRENHPEAELEIISIERRGEDHQGTLIRVETIPQADHSQLHAEYFNRYDQLQALSPEQFQHLLAEKDSQIRRLEAWVDTVINRPSIHAEHYHQQGDTMSDNRGNVEIGSVGGNISGFAVAGGSMAGVAGGDISGTVTASINELPATSEPEKPGIKELLTQLQAAIEAESSLSKEDKEEALKQVKTLAEAGQNPQEGAMQKMAKDALRFLKGLLTELPTAVALVEKCKELLPTIAGLFGF